MGLRAYLNLVVSYAQMGVSNRLAHRLMAGLQILVLCVLVRIQLGQLPTKKNLCNAEVFQFCCGSYSSKSSTCQLAAKNQDHLMSDEKFPFIDRAAWIRDTVQV